MFWEFVRVDCWCFGSLLGSSFGVLVASGRRFLLFGDPVELILGAGETLSGFLGSRTCPRDQRGSILRYFGAHLGSIWGAFWCHFRAMLQLFESIFGMPNSSLFRRRSGCDFW